MSMSDVGQNRTCRPEIVMSALLRLTDSSRTSRHVRFVPEAAVTRQRGTLGRYRSADLAGVRGLWRVFRDRSI
jgi:hypothetical protein